MSRKDTDARVLLALIAERREQGRATVRSVAARADMPLMTTHKALERLREEELVAWEDGTTGTLRPLVEVVR